MPRVCLQFVIVVFPDHPRLLFFHVLYISCDYDSLSLGPVLRHLTESSITTITTTDIIL